MIPTKPQPEPIRFNADVRLPGQSYLRICPNPSRKGWQTHSFWKNSSDDLYRAYSGICAYTGEWFSKTSTSTSVDHFIPKSIQPSLAYEWGNYRLTTQKANNNKADKVGIVDPFTILSGWFTLDLPSCLIKPGKGLSLAITSQIKLSIKILKLNDDDEYVQNRCNIIIDYINGEFTLNYMWKKYPFIAHELTRQNMLDEVKRIFRYKVTRS